MRYVLLIFFALPVLVCVMPALILIHEGKDEGPFLNNFLRVENGMTLPQVETLLGGPPGHYNGATGRGMMTLEGYRPANSSSELVWLDKSHYFEVHFDAEGFVVGSHKRISYLEQAEATEPFLPRTWRKARTALGF